MSDKLRLKDNPTGRALFDYEKALLRAMLGSEPSQDLNNLRVIPIGETGTHSLAFVNEGGSAARYGKEIAQANYVDGDDIPVNISVSVDEEGKLSEMDFWKVDFGVIKNYPRPADLY